MKSHVALAAALLMFGASPVSSAASASSSVRALPATPPTAGLTVEGERGGNSAGTKVQLAHGAQGGTQAYFDALDSYASWMKLDRTEKRRAPAAKSAACSTDHGKQTTSRATG